MSHVIDNAAKRNGATIVLWAGPGDPLGLLVIMDSFADDFGNFWASTNSEKTGALNLAVGPDVSHPTIVNGRAYLRRHDAIQLLGKKAVEEIYGNRPIRPPVNSDVYHVTGQVSICEIDTCICKKILQGPVKIFYMDEGDISKESLHKDNPLEVNPEKRGSGKKKKESTVDPRSQHPAIQTFREIMKTYPQRSEAPEVYGGDWWDAIIRTVGEDDSSLKVWAEALRKWAGISSNKFNIDRQLALYREKAGKREPVKQTYPDPGDPGDVQRIRTPREERAGELGISDQDFQEWEEALRDLRGSISPEALKMLESCSLITVGAFSYVLVSDNPRAVAWINGRLIDIVRRALS